MDQQPVTAMPVTRPPGPVTRAVMVVLKAVAATGMFLMMAITFLDVIGRYFMKPIFGAPEMIQFLLALTIFAAMGLATATHAHITVDIFTARLRRRFGRSYDLLIRVGNLTGMILIAWQLVRLAVEAGAAHRMSIVLEWPLVWVIGPAAALALAAVWIDLIGYSETAEPQAEEEAGK